MAEQSTAISEMTLKSEPKQTHTTMDKAIETETAEQTHDNDDSHPKRQ